MHEKEGKIVMRKWMEYEITKNTFKKVKCERISL